MKLFKLNCTNKLSMKINIMVQKCYNRWKYAFITVISIIRINSLVEKAGKGVIEQEKG